MSPRVLLAASFACGRDSGAAFQRLDLQQVVQIAVLVEYSCSVLRISEPLTIGVVAVLVLSGWNFQAAFPAPVTSAFHGRGGDIPIIERADQVNRPFGGLVKAELDGSIAILR